MMPIHYKANILPDGHLPVHAGFLLPAGEEIEITLPLAGHGNGGAEGGHAELFERDGLLFVRAGGLASAAAFDHRPAREDRIDKLTC